MSDIDTILLTVGFAVVVIYSLISRSDSDDEDDEDCENS